MDPAPPAACPRLYIRQTGHTLRFRDCLCRPTNRSFRPQTSLSTRRCRQECQPTRGRLFIGASHPLQQVLPTTVLWISTRRLKRAQSTSATLTTSSPQSCSGRMVMSPPKCYRRRQTRTCRRRESSFSRETNCRPSKRPCSKCATLKHLLLLMGQTGTQAKAQARAPVPAQRWSETPPQTKWCQITSPPIQSRQEAIATLRVSLRRHPRSSN